MLIKSTAFVGTFKVAPQHLLNKGVATTHPPLGCMRVKARSEYTESVTSTELTDNEQDSETQCHGYICLFHLIISKHSQFAIIRHSARVVDGG